MIKAAYKKWIGESHQPTISRPKAALLARRIAEVLKIKNAWTVFEAFWERKNMRNDYQKAIEQQGISDFIDELKDTIK